MERDAKARNGLPSEKSEATSGADDSPERQARNPVAVEAPGLQAVVTLKLHEGLLKYQARWGVRPFGNTVEVNRVKREFAIELITRHALMGTSLKDLGCDGQAAVSHESVVDLICQLAKRIERNEFLEQEAVGLLPERRLQLPSVSNVPTDFAILACRRTLRNTELLVEAFCFHLAHSHFPNWYWRKRRLTPFEKHVSNIRAFEESRIGALVERLEESVRMGGNELTPEMHHAITKRVISKLQDKEMLLLNNIHAELRGELEDHGLWDGVFGFERSDGTSQ